MPLRADLRRALELGLGPALALLLGPAAAAQAGAWRVLPGPAAYTTKRLVHDDDRGRLVMVESSADANVFRTWERVGDHWSLRHTPTTPPPRDHFAAGYDPLRRRVVVFGGQVLYQWSAPGALLADTWEYDGTTWQQRTLPNGPPPTTRAWLCFDHANGKLLLCGGMVAAGSTYAGLYDGKSWAQVASAPASLQSLFASDPLRGEIVLWNGNATTIWDGTTWTPVAPPTSPPPIALGGLVFDGGLGAVVLLTGTANTVPNTTRWAWNGATWQMLGGPPTPPRVQASFAYDARHGRTVAVGGAATAGWWPIHHETLVWDGTTWSATGQSFQPEGATACFDTQRDRLIAFTKLGIGAAWDGHEWTSHAPIPAGVGGGRAAVAYDEARQRLVAMKGGQIQEWTGAAWTAPTAVPFPPIAASTLVYHRVRSRVMTVVAGSGTWEWDGVAWAMLDASAGAIDGAGRNLVYDAATARLLTCGTGGSPVATWDTNAWTVQTPQVAGLAFRDEFTLGFDPVAQQVVLVRREGADAASPVRRHVGVERLHLGPRSVTSKPSPRFEAGAVVVPWLDRLVLVGGCAYQWNGGYSQFGDLWALDAARGATASLGAGCTLCLLAPVPAWPVVTDAAGEAQLVLPLPLALAGFRSATQADVIHASAPLGVALTRGLRLTIGW